MQKFFVRLGVSAIVFGLLALVFSARGETVIDRIPADTPVKYAWTLCDTREQAEDILRTHALEGFEKASLVYYRYLQEQNDLGESVCTSVSAILIAKERVAQYSQLEFPGGKKTDAYVVRVEDSDGRVLFAITFHDVSPPLRGNINFRFLEKDNGFLLIQMTHEQGHETDYSKWFVPGTEYSQNPQSCCNKQDCKEREARVKHGQYEVFANNTWCKVPESRILWGKSPNGRAHGCVSPLYYDPHEGGAPDPCNVLCFAPGTETSLPPIQWFA